jgi:hypothetical protein
MAFSIGDNMPDIDISVGINLVDASLRDIASQVRRTFANITPEIEVGISADKIKGDINKLLSSKRLLEIAGIKDAEKLKGLATQALSGIVVGTKLNDAGLTALKRSLQSAVETAAGQGLQNAAKKFQASAAGKAIAAGRAAQSQAGGTTTEGRAARPARQFNEANTGRNSDAAIQQRVLRELARREAIVRSTADAAGIELSEQTILNSTLRKLVVEEQKKLGLVSSQSTRAAATEEALRANKNTVISRSVQAEAQVTGRLLAEEAKSVRAAATEAASREERAGIINRSVAETAAVTGRLLAEQSKSIVAAALEASARQERTDVIRRSVAEEAALTGRLLSEESKGIQANALENAARRERKDVILRSVAEEAALTGRLLAEESKGINATALEFAARQEKTSIIRRSVQEEAEITGRLLAEETKGISAAALEFAARQERGDIVRRSVQKEAEVTGRLLEEESKSIQIAALEFAARQERSDVITRSTQQEAEITGRLLAEETKGIRAAALEFAARQERSEVIVRSTQEEAELTGRLLAEEAKGIRAVALEFAARQERAEVIGRSVQEEAEVTGRLLAEEAKGIRAVATEFAARNERADVVQRSVQEEAEITGRLLAEEAKGIRAAALESASRVERANIVRRSIQEEAELTGRLLAEEADGIRANAVENAARTNRANTVRRSVQQQAELTGRLLIEEAKGIRAAGLEAQLRERRASSISEVASGNSEEAIQSRIIRTLAEREVAIRGSAILSNEELRSQGISSALLRREIIARQRAVRAQEQNRQEQINNSLIAARRAIDEQIEATAQSTVFARKGAQARRDLNTILLERVNAARRAGRLDRRPGERGGRRNANSVTFRGAQDIQSFANNLNPQQLSRFIKTLIGVKEAGGSAGSAMQKFGNRVKATTGVAAALESRLTSATTGAFEFGRRIQFAGKRLLEWATPAAFLFRAVSLLQDAVSTIVQLDQQASRLEFFREGGLIKQIQEGTAELSDVFNTASANIKTFTAVARQSGSEIGNVAEAFVTLGRIGIDVFAGAVEGADRSTVAMNNQLLRTVNLLVRLEKGALSSEKAVRSLVAIQRQFNGTNADPQAEQIETSNIGAQLADVAARTSFNVNELAETTTRVGAAFAQIEGTNVASTLELIGIAAKSTGASSSRTATAFRQFIVLAQQNETALKAFGVSLREVDEDTGKVGRVTLPGLLSALQKFNQVAKDSPAQAEKRAFIQEAASAQSLEGQLNTLSATFSQLIQTIGTGRGFEGLISGAQSLLDLFQGIAESAKGVATIVAGFAGVAFAKIIPQIGAALAGAATGIFSTLLRGGVRQEINTLLTQTKSRVDGINLAEKEGLITTQQAANFRARQVQLINAQVAAQAELDGLIAQEVAETAAAVPNQTRLLQLTQRREQVQLGINALIAEEAVLQRNTVAAQSAGAATLGKNVLPAIAGIALAGATLFGDTIGEALAKDTSAQKGISSALNGAAIGGILGAQIGTAIAPGIGTAIGAASGALIGGIGAGISAAGAESDRVAKDAAARAEQTKRRLLAEEGARKQINEREKRSLILAESRTKFEAQIEADTIAIARLAAKIQATERGTTEELKLQKELITLQVGLEATRTKQAEEALNIEARKIVLARNLLNIRIEEQREVAKLALLQDIALTNLGKGASVAVKLEFKQRTAQASLDAVLKEIFASEQELQSVDISSNTKAREEAERRIIA